MPAYPPRRPDPRTTPPRSLSPPTPTPNALARRSYWNANSRGVNRSGDRRTCSGNESTETGGKSGRSTCRGHLGSGSFRLEASPYSIRPGGRKTGRRGRSRSWELSAGSQDWRFCAYWAWWPLRPLHLRATIPVGRLAKLSTRVVSPPAATTGIRWSATLTVGKPPTTASIAANRSRVLSGRVL